MRYEFDITKGDVLSVDPGTNACGVALWRQGVFIDSRTLISEGGGAINVSDRLRRISSQLKDFLDKYCADVEVVLSENPDHTLLKAMIGAILITQGVNSYFNDKHTVMPMEWKSWAKQRGASHPDGFKKIKGIAALKSTGFQPLPATDDEADAIMVYLSYKAKHGTHKAMRRGRRDSPNPEKRPAKSSRVSREELGQVEIQSAPVTSRKRKIVASEGAPKRNKRSSDYTIESADSAIPLDLSKY